MMKAPKKADEKASLEQLSKTEQLKMAIRSSLNILSAKEQTEKNLRQKLNDRGHCDDVIDAAVGYLVEKGYLNEQRYLERLVSYLAEKKLYGRARILQEVRQKGFSAQVLGELDLEEVDFAGYCLIRLEKYRRGHPIPDIEEGLSGDERRAAWHERRKAQQREAQALARYGYSGEDIRKAYELLGE